MVRLRGSLSEVYSSTLSRTLQQGYALWFPEPLRTGEVQIGDVGFIDDGALIRFFNIDPTGQHTVDAWSEIEPYEPPYPLPRNALNAQLLDTRANVLNPGTYKSRGVEESRVRANIQAGVPAGIGGIAVQFECKEECGAILTLKSPATRSTVLDNKSLRDYIAKNFEHWVNFATEKVGLEGVEKRIILVRGWVKTSPDWTVTTFTNHGAKIMASLDAQGGTIVSTGIAASTEQMTEGPVVSRSGRAVSSANPQATQDQCVFLKYYSVKLRRWWFPKLEANAGPDELPGRDGQYQGNTILAEDPELSIVLEDDSTSDEHWADFADALLNYILEFSDAEIAVGCDEDIENLLQGQEWPEDLTTYLRQTRPRIEVDDNGCGTLSLYDAIRRERQHDYANRNTDDLEGHFNLPDDQTRAGSLLDGRALLGPSRTNPTTLDWPHLQFKHKDAENGAITSISLSPDGALIAASWDDTIFTVWRLKDGLSVQVLGEQGHTDTVWIIAFSPDSGSIVSGSADSTAIVWDVATGHVVSRLEGHTADIMAVAFDPFGTLVATGSADYSVKVWDAANGTLVHDLAGHISDIISVAFSPNGNRLASCADSDVILWDPRNGTRVTSLQGHKSAIWCMAWAADGDRLVTGSEDNSSRIWNAEDGEELVILQEHTNSVWSVAFSPDGKEVASASYDATVVTCDSYTGEERHVFSDTNMSSVVETVAYSTRGDLIASGSADGHVRVWDARSGEFVVEYQGHEEKVKNVQFTPDDKDVVSYSEDGTIRVWSVLDALRLVPSVGVMSEVEVS